MARFMPLFAVSAGLTSIISAVLAPYLLADAHSPQFMLLFYPHFIFSVVSVVALTQFAGDLELYALFHLSQPISRAEYIASWLAVSVWFPQLMLLLSSAIPVYTLDPRAIGSVLHGIVIRVLEDLLAASAAAFSALLGKRTLTALVALATLLLAPYLTIVLMYLLCTLLLGSQPGQLAERMYSVLFPATCQMMGAKNPASPAYTLAIALLLNILLIYLSRRVEVS